MRSKHTGLRFLVYLVTYLPHLLLPHLLPLSSLSKPFVFYGSVYQQLTMLEKWKFRTVVARSESLQNLKSFTTSLLGSLLSGASKVSIFWLNLFIVKEINM